MNDELQMTNRKMRNGEVRTSNRVSFSSTFETQHSDFASFDIRNSTFGIRPVPPKGNANFAWVQHFIHHLSPAAHKSIELKMLRNVASHGSLLSS